MPRTITKRYKVYKFDELSARAKDKAREWWRNGGLDYDWWEYLYDDAERIGLEITGFDLDRNKHATGNLIMDIRKSVAAILKDHGKDCETYKIAQRYQEDIQEAIVKARLNDEDDCEECAADALEGDYLNDLLDAYADLLQREYEYLLSDEAVDETIRANEYEFTKEGKRA